MHETRQTISLPSGDVSYLEWNPAGDGASATVLLLHGGGLDSAALSWGEFGPALAQGGYHVIAPDHPGYGLSPASSWAATQERLVSYVAEFVDALQLRRYAIGGLSLGAGLAIGHVLERPDRVAGVLLLGGYGVMNRPFEGGLGGPAQLLSWVMLRTGMLRGVMRLYGRDRRLLERSIRSLVRNPEQRTTELIDDIMVAAARAESSAAFEQWQRDQFLWNRLRTNYSSRLPSITRPTLLVHGERDTGVPIARAAEAAQRLPHGRLVTVPDAGHWVQRDRPDLVVPAVLEFLTSLE